MNVHRLVVAVVLSVVFGVSASAQFKSQVEQSPRVSEYLMSPASSSTFLGWFNPEKFRMRHAFSLSYHTGAGNAFSLGTYTNIMTYEFAENLNARADVSLSYSPYNTFATHGKNDLSALYLSRAQVNYKPWDNVLMQLEYRQMPYYNPYYSPFYNPWYRGDGF